MKKLIVLALSIGIIALGSKAQNSIENLKFDKTRLNEEEKSIKKVKRMDRKALRKLQGNTVNQNAKDNFRNDFGNVQQLVWSREENYDEANFIKDGQAHTAFYDADAKLVGSSVNKKFSDLPGKAQKFINKNYSGYSIGDVIYYDDNEANETDMLLYGTQFEDEDSYFVELKIANHKIVLQVDTNGIVSLFKKLY